MYLNRATIIGNLTRDPELKSLPSGVKVVSFSVATNRVWYDQNRQKQEATDYHNIVSFGKQAETIAQYMKKGSSIYVEGRLQTRSWDQDGKKQYRTEILAEKFQFGPKAGGAPGASPSPVSSSNNAGGAEEQEPPMIDSVDYPEEDINPEDIPF
jgi:single-strand DNA-binding protein